MAQSLEEIRRARDLTIHILEHLGFVINHQKSILTPTKCLEFLGVLVDSRHFVGVSIDFWWFITNPKCSRMWIVRSLALLISSSDCAIRIRSSR
jgi:hypothetical protein